MGIPKNYFRDELRRHNIKATVFGCNILVKAENIGIKLDRAQDMIDEQVWSDIQRYMPHDTGNLIEQTNMYNQVVRGEVYLYPPELDYGHYQYEGMLYVDPKYDKGAFYSPEYGFWSRPGVDKVKSDRPLFYSNPDAEGHWDEIAYKNHKQQWVKVGKRALR